MVGGVPRSGVGLADREGAAVVLRVDADDLDLHMVALGHDVFGRGVALPRERADVDEPFHGTEVDENAEGSDAADVALKDVALVDLLVEGLASL